VRNQYKKLFRKRLIYLASSATTMLVGIIVFYRISHVSVKSKTEGVVASLLSNSTKISRGYSKTGYVLTQAVDLNDEMTLQDLQKKITKLLKKARSFAGSNQLKKATRDKLTITIKVVEGNRQNYKLADAKDSVAGLKKIIAQVKEEIAKNAEIKKQLEFLQKLCGQVRELVNKELIKDDEKRELESHLNRYQKLANDQNTKLDDVNVLIHEVESSLLRISDNLRKRSDEEENRKKEEAKKQAEEQKELPKSSSSTSATTTTSSSSSSVVATSSSTASSG